MKRLSFCLAALSLAAAGCSGSSPSPSARVDNGQALARSLAIIRSGTPAKPSVLRILFYGQSISSTAWTDPAVAWLRKTYPNTRFVVANMAIGGFDSQLLERTAARDLTDFYPDLVVFHVYGDHRAYERIVRTIRSRTAAEVILQNDHVVDPVEPMCDEGLHLTLQPPPGCRGTLWYRQNSWQQHMSGEVEPGLARRYGLALEDRRSPWNAYLQRHGLQPADLLADAIHPNAQGWRLMAALFERFFARQAEAYAGQRSDLVRAAAPPADAETKTYRFDGNRIELIASGLLDGKVEALIDGRPPQDVDGCWQASRTTPIADLPEWPAASGIVVAPGFHHSETWTATLTNLSPMQDKFDFAVSGQATGPDGAGHATEDFASPSGRLRIPASAWNIPRAVATKDKKVWEGFEVSWSNRFVCRDQPATPLSPSAIEVRHVIATDLPNGPHELRLRVAPEAVPLLRELRIYHPPLRD